ncbi:MAG TPA: hypothetical protein VK021_00135 [Flavobacteriaceae bacterium]|nr:hypothetical protein [Flavobacteriaceae bacterium]
MQKKILLFSMLPLILVWLILSLSKGKLSQSTVEEEFVEVAELQNDVASTSDLLFTVDTNQVDLPLLQKDYFGFKEAVGYSESRGFYHLVNKFGYMGKYQFGKSALASIGVYNTQNFVSDPAFQEEAFFAFTSRNKWLLRHTIEKYEGKTIGGVLVTESGILAAAHLAGPSGVKRFLYSNGTRNFSDAFGTQIKHYMQKFGGYDLSAVKADKHAGKKLRREISNGQHQA